MGYIVTGLVAIFLVLVFLLVIVIILHKNKNSKNERNIIDIDLLKFLKIHIETISNSHNNKSK